MLAVDDEFAVGEGSEPMALHLGNQLTSGNAVTR